MGGAAPRSRESSEACRARVLSLSSAALTVAAATDGVSVSATRHRGRDAPPHPLRLKPRIAAAADPRVGPRISRRYAIRLRQRSRTGRWSIETGLSVAAMRLRQRSRTGPTPPTPTYTAHPGRCQQRAQPRFFRSRCVSFIAHQHVRRLQGASPALPPAATRPDTATMRRRHARPGCAGAWRV